MAKQKERKIGWAIFWCSMCKTYQETAGQCQNCGYAKVIKKCARTSSKYCELLGKHALRVMGSTALPKEPARRSLFGYIYPYINVWRCVRCGIKKTKRFEMYEGYEGTHPSSRPKSWGEQVDR